MKVKTLTILISCFWMVLIQRLPGQAIDQSVLNQIEERAIETHSDAFLIIKDGKELLKGGGKLDKPIYIASAGKSLTSLAIGKLLDLNLLDSLDQLVHTLFPEWKQGKKKDITVRMLLNHTSGLQNYMNASLELEPPPTYKVENVIKLALAAELDNEPGAVASYNNKATALLAGIVEKASGKRMDKFFEEEFYAPMGITEFSWIRDNSGNPTAHGAFVLRPSDFIKFGELMLNGGVYKGKRIISQGWVDESLKEGSVPIWGLLWWRFHAFEKRVITAEIVQSWKGAGIDEEFIKKLEPLKGQIFQKADYFQALQRALGSSWQRILNETVPQDIKISDKTYSEVVLAYYADGFRGNYLVIVPEKGIIAVRCADHEGFVYGKDGFDDFVELVTRL